MKKSQLTYGLISCALLAGAFATPAAPAPWAPKLYTYCMDMADTKKRSVPEQAQLLRELGFDGEAFGLWLDDSCEKNLKTFDDAGLQVYLFHTMVKITNHTAVMDPRLPEAMHKLKGRNVAICPLITGLKPADPDGMAPAVALLREMGDIAQETGNRISLYQHVNNWTESLPFIIEVMRKVNHPAVGFNFNLYHWLKVNGNADYKPLLRENAAKLQAVIICGAQLGTTTWTDGLIQPLDKGDFNNRELLAFVRDIGYRGPIGLMCFGIKGDAKDHLERSLKVWKSWQAEWAKP